MLCSLISPLVSSSFPVTARVSADVCIAYFLWRAPLPCVTRQGFDKKTSRLFTPKDFMSTYTTCYDMCTQRSPYNWSEQLYDRHGDTISQVGVGGLCRVCAVPQSRCIALSGVAFALLYPAVRSAACSAG